MSEAKKKSRAKVRGNGMGCAYQRPGEKTWTVEVVTGWRYPNGDITKPKRPVRKKKGGFSSKKDALAYADTLRKSGTKRVRKTMEEVYLAWKNFYVSRIGASTMEGYKYAYNHFKPLHGTYMDLISANDLQQCMDNCKSGKRTHENMKCIAGLLWKYAIDENIIDRNITSNLYTGSGRSIQRESLSEHEEAVIHAAISTERYADYVYCLINLGYRPGEFLELKKDMLFCAPLKIDDTTVDVWYLVNGKKTDAGRDRIVIVPDDILEIILSRIYIPGTDYIFPQYQFTRGKKQKFIGFKKMTDAYFRVEIFKPMMERLGIAYGKVPYSARHSFADKLKKAPGSDKDKASLIGHSDYLFTQDKYQSSHLLDLYDIVKGFSTPTVLPPSNPQHVEK